MSLCSEQQLVYSGRQDKNALLQAWDWQGEWQDGLNYSVILICVKYSQF